MTDEAPLVVESNDDADWIKYRTLDLPATNLDELRVWLYRTGRTEEEFKRTPLYRMLKPKLPWLAKLG